ncbi:MAG: hypothetical protein OXN84_06650 [Albidovulum sp.]|nr:hypothetical protein [Albidovulum sp.]
MAPSIVASIIDPMDDDSGTRSPHARPSAEFSPDDRRVSVGLASPMTHFEARVAESQEHGILDHLAEQYQHPRLLLIETATYQLSVSSSSGQTPR